METRIRGLAVASPWTMGAGTSVDGGAASAARAASLTNASKAETTAGLVTAKKVAEYLQTGSKPPFTPTKGLAAVGKDLLTPVKGLGAVTSWCQPWSTNAKPEQSVRVVRTSEGTLTVAVMLCAKTQYGTSENRIFWQKPFAKALAVSSDPTESLTQYYAVTVSFEKLADNKLVGVGVSRNTVRPGDTPR